MDRAAFDQKRPMRLPDLLTHRRTRVFTIENLRRILERGPNQTISKRELRRWAVEASR